MSKKKSQPFYPPPALPRTGVESHAHLNSRQYNLDREDVIARAAAAGVAQIIQVFLSPEAWRTGKVLFDHHPHIYFILGIHPTEAQQFTDDMAELDMAVAIMGGEAEIADRRHLDLAGCRRLEPLLQRDEGPVEIDGGLDLHTRQVKHPGSR